MDTIIADQDGTILSSLTPGAQDAQQKVFERIRARSAETIAGLLRLNRDAPNRVREFVRSADGRTAAFNTVDSNYDGIVSLDEFRNANTSSELSINELMAFISDELKLDMLTPETRRTIAVDLSELNGDLAAPFFTYDGVSDLTWWYVPDRAIAESLSAKLRAAEAAEARGDLRAKTNLLRAYTLQVAMLTCTTLTIKQAATLSVLAMTL